MHINRHLDFASLTPLKDRWNELASGVPFRRWQWLETWWRHYGCHSDGATRHDRELFVLTVWDDDNQLAAIAPWYRLTTRSGAHVIRFLGDGEVCSDYLSVLCRPAAESEIAEALTEWLTVQNQLSGPNRWDRLELIGAAADDAPVNQLLMQLQTQGNTVHYTRALNTWRVPLPASWEEYLMVLSKPHRNRLRRADKTYLKTGLVQVHQVQSAEQIPQFFDIFVELHQKHWQRKGFPGCFASAPFQAFHRELAELFFAENLITLSWLEMDGKPLAAEYRFHGDDLMYAYQCGIDPDRLQVRPGELANMASIRDAIEHGKTSYDFLRGDEPYKAHSRAEPRPMFTIRVIPRRVSARVRHRAWLAGQNAKQLLKDGLQLVGLRKLNPIVQKH